MPSAPHGEITGPFVHARVLAAIERIARRYGDAIDVIGSGGIMSPEGVTIMGVGITIVFVPQDLAYMEITVDGLNAVNPRLVPLIAHDRAGFGGGLFSGGLTVFFSLWCGARPGAKGLWAALCCAGIVGFACAIGIHPIVGYTDFIHLAPAHAGAIMFLTGISLLYRPLWRGDPAEARFSDLS